MASTNDNANTIDLTLDDDTPPPPSRRTTQSPDFYLPDSPSMSPLRASAESEQRRAPPFGPGERAEPLEVIDLSDEDEDPAPRPATRPAAIPVRSSSPEIQFVREQPAQANFRRPDPPAPAASRREPWHPPQPPAAALADRFMNFARQQVFGNLHLPFVYQPQNAAPPNQGAGDRGLEVIEGGDNFGDINFNYQQAAFQVGNRESETPQATQQPYKAPPDPQNGYIRSYTEDSILICPYCNNELATGGKDEDDPKRQVWVNRACAHVSICYIVLITH